MLNMQSTGFIISEAMERWFICLDDSSLDLYIIVQSSKVKKGTGQFEAKHSAFQDKFNLCTEPFHQKP